MGAACCGERQHGDYAYDTVEPFNRDDYKELSPEVSFLFLPSIQFYVSRRYKYHAV